MLPADLKALFQAGPTLYHLADDVDAELWGREPGFPVVLFDAATLDEEALMELSDSYDDALSELEVELFDEEGWRSERYTLIGVLGVFDDPDDEQLGDAFPFVAQLDGLLLWDAESSSFKLMDGELDSSARSFEEALTAVAPSLEALRAQLR